MIGVVVALLLATGAALPGLESYDEIMTAGLGLTLAPRRFAWVVMLNGRPADRHRRAFRRELDRALWTAKTSVKKWPEGDLFVSP